MRAELIRLKAYGDYFKGTAKVKSLIIKHVAKAATQQLLLESRDVDIAKNLTPDQIESLDKEVLKVYVFQQAAVHCLSFNQKTKSLTPPAVWEAACFLVNYEGMTNSIIKGQIAVRQAFWPKGFPDSYDEMPYAYGLKRPRAF